MRESLYQIHTKCHKVSGERERERERKRETENKTNISKITTEVASGRTFLHREPSNHARMLHGDY